MNTQNTPVHVRLWHRDFLLMLVANMLMTAAVYILVPILPEWLMQAEGFTHTEVAWCMGAFGLGLYLFGGLCNYLVQRFRRNRVCVLAMSLLALSVALLYYVQDLESSTVQLWVILVQRFLMGAFFGLAQMVLSSTLIIDTCESFQRTEANYSAAWFSRFALSIGPLAGLVSYTFFGIDMVLLASIVCVGIAVVLVMTVRFPFRSPADDVQLFSTDRFFLPYALPLFLNLLAVSTVIGMLMSLGLSDRFYGMMMGGFLLALLAQRFVFRNAELKSEVVSGLILLLAALLMMYTRPRPVVWYIAPAFVGLAIGIIGSRFLLFFIKLSRHCQRGTSQSTCFLGWETGIAIGLWLGYACFFNDSDSLFVVAMALTAASLVVYQYFTHSWFLKHKNR